MSSQIVARLQRLSPEPGTGCGPVGHLGEGAPGVSDVSVGVSPDGYNSGMVRRYERSSRQTRELFRMQYVEGLSTGDF